MRIPVWLGWLLLALGFFTAGLLRQFHDRTPVSPFAPAVVGSLLFAAIFFLLLVAARERRRGAVRGPGIRLGSLTPILLMLLIEKWFAQTLYVPLFRLLAPAGAPPELQDAWFRALAGAGLLAVSIGVGFLSVPALRKTWRRARPGRFPQAALATAVVVLATYAATAGLVAAAGVRLELRWPDPGPLLWWILAGQALLAFAEEVYFRGLLLNEMERLAPRMGARAPATRRWIALGFTSALFGMEHIRLADASTSALREVVFIVALGLLFGLLVMMSWNLHYAAGLHAWVNWLLLGAAPHFVNPAGRPVLPPGIYIGCALLAAFGLAVLVKGLRRRGLLPFARRGTG